VCVCVCVCVKETDNDRAHCVLYYKMVKVYPSTSKDEAILSTALQTKCVNPHVIIYNFCICVHNSIMLCPFSYNACLSTYAYHLGWWCGKQHCTCISELSCLTAILMFCKVFIRNYCHFSWLSSTAILTHVSHGFHQRLSWLKSCMVFISSYPNSCLVWFSSTAILTHVSHGFHQRLSWLMSCMVFHQRLSWLMSRMVLITS